MLSFTIRQLIEADVWDEYCAIAGANPWAASEDQLPLDEEIELTPEQANALGLSNTNA